MSNSEFALRSNRFASNNAAPTPKFRFDLLHPIRQWLDGVPIENAKLARFLYKAIPGHCPFERDIIVLGHKLAHIPPLCKLNPLYDQLVGLRFRSMCYLVEQCGEAL